MRGSKSQQTVEDLRRAMLAACAIQRRVDAFGRGAAEQFCRAIGAGEAFDEWEAATAEVKP